jgi:phage shock protein A
MAIGRLFKSIWYMLTGRAHELSDKIMENPEAVRGAYEDIIKDKKENIQRYKGAVGQLMALLKQKQVSVQELTQEITRLEDLKKGALAKAKQVANDLQSQGISPEEIKTDVDYTKCVAAYNDFSSTLAEKEARIGELEEDIQRAQQDIDGHKVQLETLTRDLKKIQEEQSEAVADLISARETEEIADMLSGISKDGTNQELVRMREVRQKAKSRAEISQELAGTDANSQENEFLEAARSSETSDEFDALIFGAEQSDSVETPTTKNTDVDSELPI